MSAPSHAHPEDIIDTNKLITLINDNHDVIVFEPVFNVFVSFSGAPTTSVELVGYILHYSNPTQPIIYPLYSPLLGLDAVGDLIHWSHTILTQLLQLQRQLCLVAYLETPMLHGSALEAPGYEVPVFAIMLQAMETPIPYLNLRWVRGRTGLDTALHGVYHYDDVARAHEPEVKVYLVAYPFGNYIPDVDTSINGSAIFQTTWIGLSVTTFDTPCSSVVHRQPRPRKKILAEHSLHQIMETCMNWRKALAYLHMLLRVAICYGRSDNPHLLVNVEFSTRRLELIRNIWPECLLHANVASGNLETGQELNISLIPTHTESFLVLTKITQLPMSHNDVLALASPWVTQFMYDNRRMVINSMDNARVFGLGNFFGLAQREIVIHLLTMFTRPHAHLLPIEANFLNGFATFLKHQAAKELIYHMILRTTSTSRIRFTIADLEPNTFRNVANPPVDTLALAGSSITLFARLLSLFGANETMPDYPSAAQIHSELRETVIMLLQQENDPHIAQFKAELQKLCIITETDVYHIGQSNGAQAAGPSSSTN
ncbi:hypothetical protein EV702DRAFT_1195316 [Suillus placidus]|uniref:Uncharacterized protein n=1 Tax=Suillus placidus TaxID=48579 RepID=A0A9P6ZZQ2_9AGAM|nr:hypothetical protein EV702DRAFT_1195316 [Suillus placidus]